LDALAAHGVRDRRYQLVRAGGVYGGIIHLVGVWVLCSVFPAGRLSIDERELVLQARLEQLRLGVSFAEAGASALAKWGFSLEVCEAVARQLAPSLAENPRHRDLAGLLSRAIAVADWHYGVKNEVTLLRSDLTINDLEECNQRAAAKIGKVSFGF